ncbi:hypothetical protein VUR80DRAFT_6283 [Thermomyces stellatus]
MFGRLPACVRAKPSVPSEMQVVQKNHRGTPYLRAGWNERRIYLRRAGQEARSGRRQLSFVSNLITNTPAAGTTEAMCRLTRKNHCRCQYSADTKHPSEMSHDKLYPTMYPPAEPIQGAGGHGRAHASCSDRLIPTAQVLLRHIPSLSPHMWAGSTPTG